MSLLKTLRFLNWNSHGVYKKRFELIDFINSHSIDIACITETHLTSDVVLRIQGYNCIRNDRPGLTTGGGVLILVKKTINYFEIDLPLTPGLETVAIRIIFTDNNSITVIAAYKPPNKKSR